MFKNVKGVFLPLVLLAFVLLSACGGGGSSAGGKSGGGNSGSGGTSLTLAGVIYSASETQTSGELVAQNLYTNGTVGTSATVATYCAANNDHDLIADTTVNTSMTYIYVLCRNSGQILGYGLAKGSAYTTTPTKVADINAGACCPAQQALTLNGKFLFVASETNNTVSEYSVGANGALTSFGNVLTFSGTYGVYSLAISPSGNYLVLARADSAGTTYYLDEYTIDNTTGSLSQVGSDVTIDALNTFGGLFSAQNTNNGDLLAYVTQQGGNNIMLILAGDTWSSSNIVTEYPLNGSAAYGGATFDSTGKYLFVGATQISGECSDGGQLQSYSIGASGNGLTFNNYTCGEVNTSGNPAAYDAANALLISGDVFNVGTPKSPAMASTTASMGDFGQVFVK